MFSILHGPLHSKSHKIQKWLSRLMVRRPRQLLLNYVPQREWALHLWTSVFSSVKPENKTDMCKAPGVVFPVWNNFYNFFLCINLHIKIRWGWVSSEDAVSSDVPWEDWVSWFLPTFLSTPPFNVCEIWISLRRMGETLKGWISLLRGIHLLEWWTSVQFGWRKKMILIQRNLGSSFEKLNPD